MPQPQGMAQLVGHDRLEIVLPRGDLPGVGDCGEAEVQPLELRQPFELLQASVGDLGARQV